MKTKNNIVGLMCMLALAITSCSESFLDQPPYGSTLTQAQYEQLRNTLEASIRGTYTMMYAVSDHDLFGQRGIDLATDLLSGDIALTAYTYGWFYNDESGQTAAARTSYVWSYYYGMLRNINKVINTANRQSDINARIAQHGLHNVYN